LAHMWAKKHQSNQHKGKRKWLRKMKLQLNLKTQWY
jgi:hypothetical protein